MPRPYSALVRKSRYFGITGSNTEPLKSEQLVVAPAGIERGLDDDIRRQVGCDRHGVQESRADIGDVGHDAIDGNARDAAGSCRTLDGVDRGGVFDRKAQPERRAEILHEPELPLANYVEA